MSDNQYTQRTGWAADEVSRGATDREYGVTGGAGGVETFSNPMLAQKRDQKSSSGANEKSEPQPAPVSKRKGKGKGKGKQGAGAGGMGAKTESVLSAIDPATGKEFYCEL